MNQQLIFQQLSQLTGLGINKGKEPSEAANEANALIKALLVKANEMAKIYPGSNEELIFHQLTQYAYGKFSVESDIQKVTENVAAIVSDLLSKAKVLESQISG
ncbi:hypothetical protein [Leptospira stimsonii]|uniref:Uncharacterized protein n=1 Tax=Leptospira stimsonii TaxID=2202203 RepID=A0A8B3CHE2_9LEPT|nr:hypothetical protein [Leptospira stimsonii]RHX83250.1 hypothetical protein DLM78_22355 [Leptospira stimsonii]